MEDPARQQNPEREQRERQNQHTRDDEPNERPVRSPGLRGRRQMSLKQRHVPKIGFPDEVEEIPEYGNRAEPRVERHISGHAQQSGPRGPEAKRFDENPCRKNSAGGIAGAGNQSQEGIETDSIQPVRELAESRETYRAATIAAVVPRNSRCFSGIASS